MTEGQLSFTAFVLSLASTAAIHFGDLPDPISGERAEPNLEGATQMIEILSLLEQKTRGNLTAEEREFSAGSSTSCACASSERPAAARESLSAIPKPSAISHQP